ncbi:MAG: glycosyltransferase family 4 protein [Phototrophicaceae bacterium]
MNLIIDKNSFTTPEATPHQQVLTFDDVKHLLRNPSRLLQHILHYKSATLKFYDMNSLSRPFLSLLLLRLFSYGAIYFEDDNGTRIRLTFKHFLGYARGYVTTYFRKNSVLAETKSKVQAMQHIFADYQVDRTLNLDDNPIYLRTDIAFGYRSGGSIGHIAGVANNLSHFGGHPLFITTDFIPTVREDINQQIVQFKSDFWNFPEIISITTNPQITIFTEAQMQKQPISFIYQRYSLNNFTGVELAHKYKLPFVLEYNGSEVWIRRHWGDTTLSNEQLSIDIELLNFSAADVIVVVSSPLRDELIELGVDADKILVNPNGVDPERYSPQIDGSAIRQQYDFQDKIVIGFIGTFGAWHGAEVLAEAYGLLLQKHPDYKDTLRLLLIGDGQKMPLVKDNLNQYDALPYTILTGRIPQAEGAEYLAACDILASPHVPNPDGTPFFGSPTKLFEYMAMGRGIVASDLDQIGDILDHNQTAYMVTPGDAQSLADGLKALIDDAALRQRLGEAARQDVIANYTWYEHTRKIMDKLKARFA